MFAVLFLTGALSHILFEVIDLINIIVECLIKQ